MKKIFFGIGIIGVVAIGWLFISSRQMSLNNWGGDVKNQKAAAGWRTHRSEEYGYEVQYPPAYQISSIGVAPDVSNIDRLSYEDDGYLYTIDIFARDADFIIKNCLRDAAGDAIGKTVEVNGNAFYEIQDRAEGTGGRMALAIGSLASEYHVMHDNRCYVVSYIAAPKKGIQSDASGVNRIFGELEEIVSTFRFTR